MSSYKNNIPNSSTSKEPQMITFYDFAIILDSHVLIISGHNCIVLRGFEHFNTQKWLIEEDTVDITTLISTSVLCYYCQPLIMHILI